MIKISVIIPNYNHAPYLNERIDSVLKQTFQNFEIIILDDCSTDNSREIIESYRGNQKISKIIYNEYNSGSTFNQWKKGINEAEGEYIWLAESDDVAEPGFLETLISGINRNNNIVIAYSQSYLYRMNENKIYTFKSCSLLEEVVEGNIFCNDRLLPSNCIWNASMAIFKKANYYNVCDEYLNYKYCGDWVFWSEISKQGNVYISGKQLNIFRKHDKDVSGKFQENGNSYIEEINAIRFFIQKNELSISKKNQIFEVHYFRFKNNGRLLDRKIKTKIDFLFLELIGKKRYYFLNFKIVYPIPICKIENAIIKLKRYLIIQ